MSRKRVKNKEQVAPEQPVALTKVTPVEKQEEPMYLLKLKDGYWLKSWSPFIKCENKSDAIRLNDDWARGHKSRLITFKKIECEIIPL